MEQLISDVINGHWTSAKRAARRRKHWELFDALRELAGYSERKATLTADYLKGRDCCQEMCDAE